MANIYLAADYSRKHEMRGCRDVLEALGHCIVPRWIDNPDTAESAGVGGLGKSTVCIFP